MAYYGCHLKFNECVFLSKYLTINFFLFFFSIVKTEAAYYIIPEIDKEGKCKSSRHCFISRSIFRFFPVVEERPNRRRPRKFFKYRHNEILTLIPSIKLTNPGSLVGRSTPTSSLCVCLFAFINAYVLSAPENLVIIYVQLWYSVSSQ